MLFLFLLPFLVYFLIYTWNVRTGTLDHLAEWTGLEIVGWVLAPGQWAERKTTRAWKRYIHLVDLRRENERLQAQVDALRLDNLRLQRHAREAQRLRGLLHMPSPPGWKFTGAHVIGHRQGPNGVLRTLLVDVGDTEMVEETLPVVTPRGVVGRLSRVGPHFSTVLLLHDPNSRIAVISETTRTSGILVGRGAQAQLNVKYIPQNEQLQEGELLLTSGLAGIFPKGIPVARVSSIVHSDISLFQEVDAQPLLNPHRLEEVFVLHQISGQQKNSNNATAAAVPF
ncbi:MAG: rod shape-determining protein MreC [Thermodesulfobacteriota bacterium]